MKNYFHTCSWVYLVKYMECMNLILPRYLGAMSVPLTELPFGFPGRIFRSPMPFGPYNLHGEVYDRFCEEQIAVVVMLASDEECLHKTGCNLRALYLNAGFQVLYLPIPDFGVPTK